MKQKRKPNEKSPLKRESRRARERIDKRPGRVRRMVRAAVPPRDQWKKALPAFGLAVVSALLVRICFRPIYFSPLAFVALVPLFWGIRRLKPAMSFWAGLLFASILGVFGTGWFVVVDRFNPFVWLGILPLAVYTGLYFAVAIAGISYLGRRLPPWGGLAGAAILWAGIEWWFSVGPLGMPYGMAQTQTGWLAMAKVAALGGMPLLSALIVAFNLSVMETIAAFKAGFGQAGALSRLAAMTTLVVLAWIYGARTNAELKRLYNGPDAFAVRVALLQPNIDQMLKYESYKAEDPARRYQLQDEMNAIQFEQLRSIERGEYDLIVTPESTFTSAYIDVEKMLQEQIYGGAVMLETLEIAKDLETPVIIGGIDNVFETAEGERTQMAISESGVYNEEAEIYGGLWLLRPTGEGVQYTADYRKVQLMPFGETVPYFGLIPGFQEKIVQIASFDAGDPGEPIGFFAERNGKRHEVRFGPSICFEDQFPYIQRHYARRGANLFVNTTNDGWFDGSSGPAWHAEMARWRSIETGLPMVRCTNSGITCVIGPTGQVLEKLPARENDILSANLNLLPDPPKTLFTKIGNLFGMLSFLGSIGLFVWLIKFRPPSH